MEKIGRENLREEIESNGEMTVVEVLEEEEYAKGHLPGAINVPVTADDFDDRIQQQVPDKDAPVVVYCANRECPASPRAARRVEELGYTEVYDYEEGKADWAEHGLRLES
jgi:rhodanese-related sulfurtransferase